MTHNQAIQPRSWRKQPTNLFILTAVVPLAVVALALLSAAFLGARDVHQVSTSPMAPVSGVGAAVGKDPTRIGVDDGDVPKGTTATSGIPAIANLDPALRAALERASKDAAAQGITIYVNSGWRSPEFQQHLLQQAVATYRSEKEASRWVATAQTSAHVSGDAVDIGRWDASEWLSTHGAKYGLCQIYDNEAWHFELRAEAASSGCPARYLDPTHDPRMKG